MSGLSRPSLGTPGGRRHLLWYQEHPSLYGSEPRALLLREVILKESLTFLPPNLSFDGSPALLPRMQTGVASLKLKEQGLPRCFISGRTSYHYCLCCPQAEGLGEDGRRRRAHWALDLQKVLCPTLKTC